MDREKDSAFGQFALFILPVMHITFLIPTWFR